MMKSFCLWMCLLITGLMSAQNATITVRVDRFNTEKGDLYLGLYKENNFLSSQPTKGKVLTVSGDTVKAVFRQVPRGEYALSCWQDINGNQRLDRDKEGIPTEPYGFSTNPTLQNYPRFKQAKFSVNGRPVNLTVHMVNK